VPADGTSAAAEDNGDFGRSPIYGQLSDKLLLAFVHPYGVPDVKHNSESRRQALNRFLPSNVMGLCNRCAPNKFMKSHLMSPSIRTSEPRLMRLKT
jgi:hypothetical protein